MFVNQCDISSQVAASECKIHRLLFILMLFECVCVCVSDTAHNSWNYQ